VARLLFKTPGGCVQTSVSDPRGGGAVRPGPTQGGGVGGTPHGGGGGGGPDGPKKIGVKIIFDPEKGPTHQPPGGPTLNRSLGVVASAVVRNIGDLAWGSIPPRRLGQGDDIELIEEDEHQEGDVQ